MEKLDWSEFDPKQDQQDKRSRDGCVTKAVTYVKNNFNQLGVCSFVSVPLVNASRSIGKIVHVYPPNSPLANFIENPENKRFVKNLDKAIKDSQLWALELWEAKQMGEDGNERFGELLGLSDNELTEEVLTKKDDIPKPSKPLFAMNSDEIAG